MTQEILKSTLNEETSKCPISEMTSLVIAIVFFGSLLYNMGFCIGINISLSDIPFSISDITNTFLSWLSNGIYVAMGAYLLAEGIAYVDKNVPEENLQKTKYGKFIRVVLLLCYMGVPSIYSDTLFLSWRSFKNICSSIWLWFCHSPITANSKI